MEPTMLAYNLALGLGLTGLAPVWLASRLAGRWAELWPRLGLYRDIPPAAPPAAGRPRVWLQAVSVGEVGVARAVADELWNRAPDLDLTVSTSTAKGLEEARAVFAGRARVMSFPLEAPWAVAAAVQRVRPQVYASLETEIWPNLLWWLHRRGASLLLLNGRLSPRSFPSYRRFRRFLAPLLGLFSHLSMISRADADRALALGAPPGRVRVDGNAKYAGLLDKAAAAGLDEPRRIMNLGDAPLLAAGSVRSGEEEPVLSAFARVLADHPGAVLAVAPRHVERAGRWLEAAAGLGLPARRWSALSPQSPRPQGTRVVVVDVMGRLLALYGLCTAAFVGASLVKLGGQNPMEPAAWGKPVFFGPDMSDFGDAAQALQEAGGGAEIRDGAGLARAWSEALADPGRAAGMGRAGREVVARWSGAAGVAAGLILDELRRKEAA